MRSMFLVTMMVAIVACGKSGSSNNSPGGSSVENLIGTWKSECLDLSGGWYAIITTEIDSEKYDAVQVHYADASCADARIVDSSARTYELGGDVEAIEGALEINIMSKSTTRKYKNSKNANSANDDEAFEYTDWSVDEAKDVTGKSYSSDSEAFRTEGEILYSIFNIEDDKFTLGDTTGNEDGGSKKNRPKSLHPSIFFKKQ